MSSTLIRIVPGPQTLSWGDNAVPFGHPVTRYLVRNNSGVTIYVAADAAASTFSTPVQHAGQLLVDAPVSVLHLYTPTTASVDDYGLGDIEVAGWAQQDTVPAGTPVLQGPYSVDHTDIPHDGDVKTLFVPQVGEHILRVYPDTTRLTQWDQGLLFVVQGSLSDYLTRSEAGTIGQTYDRSLDSLTSAAEDSGVRAGIDLATVWVCSSADPVQLYCRLPGLYPGASVNGFVSYAAAPSGWGQAVHATGTTLISWAFPQFSPSPLANFTIEARGKTNAGSAFQTLFSVYGTFLCGADAAGHASVHFGDNTQDITTSVNIVDGAWHTLAVTCNVSTWTFTFYCDGQVMGTRVGAIVDQPPSENKALTMFSTLATGADFGDVAWAGYADELAVSERVQYTGPYTPAASPFAASRLGQVGLYHFDGDLTNSVSGPPATQGHVELYALVARAVTP